MTQTPAPWEYELMGHAGMSKPGLDPMLCGVRLHSHSDLTFPKPSQ